MNLANKLTLIRIILVPPFMTLLFVDNLYTRFLALVVFISAALTDLYDGRVARGRKSVTNFGKFMDPLADKLLISAALIAFVSIEDVRIPGWMVVTIIAREFIITGLRTLALSQGRYPAASRAGKFKTTFQVVTIIAILFLLTLRSFLLYVWQVDILSPIDGGSKLRWWGLLFNHAPYYLMWVAVLATVISGVEYIWKNRGLIRGV